VIAVRRFSIAVQVLAGASEPGPESIFVIEPFSIALPCSFFYLSARKEGSERPAEKCE
jgi:hypothetical protein